MPGSGWCDAETAIGREDTPAAPSPASGGSSPTRPPRHRHVRGPHYAGDASLRGTALEYLEAVLTEPLWRQLEPRLPRAGAPRPAPRTPGVVADQLLRTTRGLRGG